jgi:putative hydrolase of the HAD superfamily
MIKTIAFDADDTLWHNETLYTGTQEKFAQLLAAYQDPAELDEKLYATEMRNLRFYGYGIKSFTLSMIETAIELSDGKIQGYEIQSIVDLAKEMLRAPVLPLKGVEEVLKKLTDKYQLLMITKGDLFDQETKIARSGLVDYFHGIEIVSEKSPEVYRKVLERYEVSPDQFLMVGNSLRSDILPVVEIGGQAVHIPYEVTWVHEVVEGEEDQKGYHELDQLESLPVLIQQIEG